MTRRAGIFTVVFFSLALVVAALEIYCRTPLDFRLPAIDLPKSSSMTLVFHGSVDADNPQFPRLIAALESTGRTVRYLRWDPWSDTRLRAAASAKQAGLQIADQLLSQLASVLEGEGATTATTLELELIAHSSGAYVLDALCERLRHRAKTPIRVRMLFLDPFQIHGFVDWTHGAREHGHCADEAIAVINTDDPAPATNRPLHQARNIDVTADPRRSGFAENGHYWALEYLILEAGSPEFTR